MSSLFSENSIEKMKQIKKAFLWTAICILIGEVAVGAIMILAQSFDPMVGRLMGTFVLCAVVLFMGVNNFSRMEKEGALVQGFAIVCLIANIIWLILAILLIWEVVPPNVFEMLKFMIISVVVAITCFLISNVWAIKETLRPVRPLKITALVCELYVGIYVIIVVLSGNYLLASDPRGSALATLASFAFIVMAIAAVIVSRSGEKKDGGIDAQAIKDNKEVQATIQDMVEKEVQARLKAEHEKTEQVASSPLQSDDAPPSLARDGEVKVDAEKQEALQPLQSENMPPSVTREGEVKIDVPQPGQQEPVTNNGTSNPLQQ